jgi:hypothetical protein
VPFFKNKINYKFFKYFQTASIAFVPPNSNNVGFVVHKPSGPIQLGPEQMAKLRSELDIVHVNIQVLREFVAQMKPAAAGGNGINAQELLQPPEDFHFIQVFNWEIFNLVKKTLNFELPKRMVKWFLS